MFVFGKSNKKYLKTKIEFETLGKKNVKITDKSVIFIANLIEKADLTSLKLDFSQFFF